MPTTASIGRTYWIVGSVIGSSRSSQLPGGDFVKCQSNTLTAWFRLSGAQAPNLKTAPMFGLDHSWCSFQYAGVFRGKESGVQSIFSTANENDNFRNISATPTKIADVKSQLRIMGRPNTENGFCRNRDVANCHAGSFVLDASLNLFGRME